MMKKLKRFALNDARMLSREELAAIEGGLDITALDNCTLYSRGQACVYGVGYCGGHQAIMLGTCAIKVGSINSIFYFLHKAAEPFNCLEQDNLA